MKKSAIVLSLLLAYHASLAAQTLDITTNKEVKTCLEKYGENSSECLEDLNDKTEDELNQVYNKKLKAMEAFDYTQWWMGDKNRKSTMIEVFKKNQAEWLTYRNDYCNVATTGSQGTHFLGASSVGCNINMNKRRISEIKMIQLKNLE